METTKLSVRGQIAIPKKIREELNLNEGDSLEVLKKGDLIILKKMTNQINGNELKNLN